MVGHVELLGSRLGGSSPVCASRRVDLCLVQPSLQSACQHAAQEFAAVKEQRPRTKS